MAIRDAYTRGGAIVAAGLAAGLPCLLAQSTAAQQPRAEKLWSLSSLIADGFEIKAATGINPASSAR